MNYSKLPLDGIQGLRQNWKSDTLSGFLVFLLALPLSLGIAKASEFPPAMGVLTAMVGGLLVTFFAGSRLTIKGPAAGLITICAGAVTEMGGGQEGWQLALGAVTIAAGIQIIFGFLKFGTFSEIFPHSAVHGMLAAIGLIIFSKQIHVLLGIDPATLKGLEPIALFERIPDSIRHADPRVTVLGVFSLMIIFGLPFIKNSFIRKIPAPMYVLAFTIPMAWLMDFKHTEPAFDMVKIGDFWGQVGLNVRFDLIETFVFWKYVLMFLFVNTIETLLTVKAIDGLDPWKRPSDPNKDLVAVGIGNSVSSVLGGLPMISEVARSSANVNFGGRTRWANFFHGFFLLVAMLLFIPVIEMIPNTALAALLIAVGYRLASPNEFFKVYKIGSEQLAIFIITILVTLATDLLMGVGAGIVVKFIFHLINGVPIGSMFKGHYLVEDQGEVYKIRINQAAVFTNILSFIKAFNAVPSGRQVVIDFTGATMLDHTFMELLHHFEEDYEYQGGSVNLVGFERFKASSSHPLAARKFSPEQLRKIEIILSPRQMELRDYASDHGFTFYPQRVRDLKKFKNFPITTGNRLLFEENIMTAHRDWGRIEISDIGLTEGVRQEQKESVVSVLELTEMEVQIPDFALEPESLWSKFSELTFGKDVDFGDQPGFSRKYYLRGQDELALRNFFNSELRDFLENREEIHLESHRNRLLLYKRKDALSVSEIRYLEKFAENLVAILSSKKN